MSGTAPTPRDPDFAARIRRSFARQPFMAHLGAELVSVAPGTVEIALPLRHVLTQQHGFGHAGATWAIADSAAGFAAQSLMPADRTVLTVELKINLLAPAEGRLLARGRVERAGRRLTVARSDVVATGDDGTETAIATALGTFMAVEGLAERET
ncbi:PaaI family thioesterase [Paralimibaculum aggregatum]|uniref:Medium/long-chain acyl-CoA thioesterase YigI n=1 Tax=Paralimibaculum aggregatum TaxID=3036245 RepID=A0ABQ6LQD1_9RHOB|nr:PaaI family thioesterase [Limibaculum sp. NKW23]GMG83069.1 PaaI family thioesterase [Limibaculum sp. NKW23]